MSQTAPSFFPLGLFSLALLAAASSTAEPVHFAKVIAQPTPVLGTSILITGNSTLRSPNQTFEIGFFTLDGGGSWYLGIWYASIPIRTYVWLANRADAVPNRLTPATLELSADGRLRLRDSAGRVVWVTPNAEPAAGALLLDTGNFVLVAPGGTGMVLWQSFDEPGDTWLPGMAVTPRRGISSWRSTSDPAPGPYWLQLRPPDFGEFELVYGDSAPPSRRVRYWSSGRWNGNRFIGVPEMTVPYIYTFRFNNPFTPEAAFVYYQKPLLPGLPGPLLTRFAVNPSGQLRQYTWSDQAASWEMFWTRPEDPCDVHALCGDLGFCLAGVGGFRPCQCLPGLQPVNPTAWGSGDFSGGCRPPISCSDGNSSGVNDDGGDEFVNLGAVELDAEKWVPMSAESQVLCEESCRKNCTCKGFSYVSESRLCRCLFGTVLDLRNASKSGSTTEQVLYLRLPPRSSAAAALSSSSATSKRRKLPAVEILSGCVAGIVVVSLVVGLFMLHWRKKRRKRGKGEGIIGSRKGENLVGKKTYDNDIISSKRLRKPAFAGNLRVFTYKELSAATRGFSEKLGHGGFGAVFRGELPPDSTPIAVKRLERRGAGGGDREFRAEVRTIGSVQHVNLVRLRGFCSDEPHRILVYEYMPNGPLSSYLLRGPLRVAEEDGIQEGTTGPSSATPQPAAPSPSAIVLPWSVRFRVAVGTARGLAYLHEECRDCIIHCDIKPENILLDESFAAKVSDFGMAKLLGRDLSRVLTTMRGTWGYVAPEWISGVAITAKADVYSYGMTLLELISGRRNVHAPPATRSGPQAGNEDMGGEKEDREKWFFPPWAARKVVEGDLAAVVDPRLQEVGGGGYDAEEARRAAVTAVWCIQDQEEARPTMSTVVKILEGNVDVGVPPLPQLLQALVSGDSFPRNATSAAALDASGDGSHSTTTSTLGD